MTYPKKELTVFAVTDLIDQRIAALNQEIKERDLALKELMNLKWKLLSEF